MLGEEAPKFCDACFSGNYAVPPRDLTKMKEETMKPVQIVNEGFEGKIEATPEEAKAAEQELSPLRKRQKRLLQVSLPEGSDDHVAIHIVLAL